MLKSLFGKKEVPQTYKPVLEAPAEQPKLAPNIFGTSGLSQSEVMGQGFDFITKSIDDVIRSVLCVSKLDFNG